MKWENAADGSHFLACVFVGCPFAKGREAIFADAAGIVSSNLFIY